VKKIEIFKQSLISLKKDTPLLLLLFLSMLYITLKVICNPLFFRQVEFYLEFIDYHAKLTCSAFIYSLIYVLSDMIVVISNKRFAIFIIIFGVLCDGLFTGIVHFVSTIDVPSVMSNTELIKTAAVNTLGSDMWRFFSHGLFASVAAAIAELLIFAYLYKKINSFFVSTVTSVVITLVTHNVILDYPMLKHEPDFWLLIMHNLAVNISIMIMYAAIVSIFLTIRVRLLGRRYNQQ